MDLTSTTLMIPIKIESLDRIHNVRAVLGYLNQHFVIKIKIWEIYEDKPFLDFLFNYENLQIHYKSIKIDKDSPFHKTKYLNEMLQLTDTPVVAVYDCDILLPVQTYIEVASALLNDEYDFIYPFKFGVGQKQLYYSGWYHHPQREYIFSSMINFLKNFNLDELDKETKFINLHSSYYGHSVFAKTDTYRQAFGENENFISYGPEDTERAYRFQKLGYRVKWWNSYVYHIEHERTKDSLISNPFFNNNEMLFEKIKNLTREELIDFYKSNNK